ncbi:hypothetical protein [Rubrivivax gelatinosus]|uniref:Lipoprotein n=1 Tax=Rubrivivax gelatinosus TaxID=28068 RepID=A0A4R2MGI3_RUBGE|nr:hypothetical protein [Rubrivivax gelatinosus]MBK1688297.1 hypothetical protein [Rubrivivax gelatinosus]TCP05571.1 hypothetical protein EV684_101443 [Rubrivivax gelatinosus]
MLRLRSPLRVAAAVVLPLAIAGCDQLGIESATAVAAKKDADGRAIGAACRHAGRAIEDCFGMNKKADKAAVFAGWKEMNDYMRENNLEVVPPQGGGTAVAKDAATEDAKDEEPAADAGRKKRS